MDAFNALVKINNIGRENAIANGYEIDAGGNIIGKSLGGENVPNAVTVSWTMPIDDSKGNWLIKIPPTDSWFSGADIDAEQVEWMPHATDET